MSASFIASIVFLLVVVFLFFGEAQAGSHRYSTHDKIPFFVNKIGPYSNPSETYPYYSLNFCQPQGDEVQHRHATFGEAIEGDHRAHSLYDIRFGVDIQWQSLCKVHFRKEDIRQFKKAIDEFYFFEFFFDDLPLRGFIGTIDRSGSVDGNSIARYYLFKHLHFEILYNNDRVIFANVSSDLRQLQELNNLEQMNVEFSYSARWVKTSVEYSKRLDFFKDSFFAQEMEIHWLSIMNSFVLVILLTGFIAIIIMRVLKNDYTRYEKEQEGEEDADDYGWKLIHGDVFRFPSNKILLSAFLGVGFQFLTLSFSILFIALFGVFYPGGGSLYIAGLVLYALTSVVSGLGASIFYKQLNGEKWAWNIVLTATLYSVPFFLVAAFVNSIAASYNTTSTISFSVILIVLAIWSFVGFPLTVLGGIAGKHMAGSFSAPCRTRHFPRAIPVAPWYRHWIIQMLMAGFLPFSAIYIELYYVYTSVWGHNSYSLYGILFLVFILLLIVTACITIALTYFQLSMEDHKWWWQSFLSGGSTGIFIYAYSFFYFFHRSKMSGTLQTAFYFGYMLVLCYYFFIMLGTVGFYSSLVFIRHIYNNLKIE